MGRDYVAGMAAPGDVFHNRRSGERVRIVSRTDELLVLDDLWRLPGNRAAEHVHPRMEERFTVLIGKATVVVDGYAIPAGSTQYDYLDVFYSSGLGTLTVPATTTALAKGESTTVTGSLVVAAVPAAGRQVSGELQVLSDQGALLGTGEVLIGSVTP